MRLIRMSGFIKSSWKVWSLMEKWAMGGLKNGSRDWNVKCTRVKTELYDRSPRGNQCKKRPSWHLPGGRSQSFSKSNWSHASSPKTTQNHLCVCVKEADRRIRCLKFQLYIKNTKQSIQSHIEYLVKRLCENYGKIHVSFLVL